MLELGDCQSVHLDLFQVDEFGIVTIRVHTWPVLGRAVSDLTNSQREAAIRDSVAVRMENDHFFGLGLVEVDLLYLI